MKTKVSISEDGNTIVFSRLEVCDLLIPDFDFDIDLLVGATIIRDGERVVSIKYDSLLDPLSEYKLDWRNLSKRNIERIDESLLWALEDLE